MRFPRLFACVAGLAGVIAFQVVRDTTVWAQTATGTIEGVIKDKATGKPLAGVTVIVSSPALPNAQTAITDDKGYYSIASLPAGIYLVMFYYADLTVQHAGVAVSANQTVPIYQSIDSTKATGEVIQVKGTAPTIDPTSTSQGVTIDTEYTRNVPVGRTFGGVLGAAAGSQGDGLSISGATSVQNTYVVGSPSSPAPDVGNNTEGYSRIDDNPFLRVSVQPLSTFSIDVDTASYANSRRFLAGGALPPKDAVRVEEMINYFHYDYPAPAAKAPFSISTEVGPSPWNPSFKLVRIGLQTLPIADADVPARNLTFLLDISGSMEPENKLPLLVKALGLLVAQLRPQDRVAIVVYASGTGVVLPSTTGNHKDAIRTALAGLEAGGSTNGAAGIQLAYQQARENFIKGGINRVILCTDGDWNVGTTSEGDLTRLIEDERKHDVFLTVLGFGMGNVKDSTMEMLADKGNGNYAYIDTIDEARKVLVKEAGATLVTVAKDVKIQVELDPAMVAGYRLIGYEDRMLRSEDFNDDKKDAGEIGAGHAVTALYEIVPAGVEVPAAKVDKLKYQSPSAPTTHGGGELMTVKVRYKAPTGNTSSLMSQIVNDANRTLDKTSTDFRWAAAVASYAMMLRESPERGSVSWPEVHALAAGAIGTDKEGYRKEFVKLVDLASTLKR
jgi:Ca-activated chloride channel homolog